MIKKLICWMRGHTMVPYCYAQGGMITIVRDMTMTVTPELCKCTRCGYPEGDWAAISWTWALTLIKTSDA